MDSHCHRNDLHNTSVTDDLIYRPRDFTLGEGTEARGGVRTGSSSTLTGLFPEECDQLESEQELTRGREGVDEGRHKTVTLLLSL